MQRRPTVSVVIPCYNYGHYLPTAVGSVLTEREVDVEVIIVEDCSTDDSADVAQRLADAHPNVRLVRNKKNLGLIGTANHGLSLVTGDYAVLLSADDASAPGALDRAAALMEANPSVGLVYGLIEAFSEELPESRPLAPDWHWVTWDGHTWADRLYRRGRNALYSPEGVVRVSTMHEVGWYDPDHPYSSDCQMWLRFAAVSDIGFISGATQGYYRKHDSNLTSATFGVNEGSGMLVDMQHRLAAFTSVAHLFPQGTELLAAVRRAIARQSLRHARRAYPAGVAENWPVEEYVRFALETDPGIQRTPSWLSYLARARAPRTFARNNPLFGAHERLVNACQAWSDRHRDATGLPR